MSKFRIMKIDMKNNNNLDLSSFCFKTYRRLVSGTSLPIIKSCTYFIYFPFGATCPRFLWVGLFMAVLSAFHTGRSCALFASMFHVFKSFVTVALHVLRGLPLPLKPSISKWVHLFTHFPLLSTCPNHIR